MKRAKANQVDRHENQNEAQHYKLENLEVDEVLSHKLVVASDCEKANNRHDTSLESE